MIRSLDKPWQPEVPCPYQVSEWLPEGPGRIARILEGYNIPYVYRQPTLLYHQGRRNLWYPEFTLPTYNNLLMEYAGREERTSIPSGARYREQIYRRNGYRTLVLDQGALEDPNGPHTLRQRLEDLVHQPLWSGESERF